MATHLFLAGIGFGSRRFIDFLEREEPPERWHPAVAGAVEREADDEGRC